MTLFNYLAAAGAAVALHLFCSLAAAADATPAVSPPAPTEAVASVMTGGDFTESTKLFGKPNEDLKGLWVLNAEFVISKDNYKNIAQLLKITDGKDGLEFHILDLELPEVARAELKKANTDRPRLRWVPSQAALKAIAEQLPTLPRRPIRGPEDDMYRSVDFVLIAPDQYQTAIGDRDPQVDKVIEGSKFVLQVIEKYKPQSLGNKRISPLITRRSVYGAKSVQKDLIKGDQVGGFISSGAGQPLPITVAGQFGMYRLPADK